MNPNKTRLKNKPKRKNAPGVYRLECIIVDSNGNYVSLGDRVRMEMPEVNVPLGDDDEYYRSAKSIAGELVLHLSKGLRIKVDSVESESDDDNWEIPSSGFVAFRRTWKWCKI